MATTDAPADRKRPNRRLNDLTVLAPLFGLILVIPPIIGLFARETTVFGAPLILLYLFGVWFGLIVLAAWLARATGRLEAKRNSGP